MIVSDEESPIKAECLNIFRMPCLYVIWDRKLDLSRIIPDIEVEKGMHVSLLLFIYVSPRSSWHPGYILSIEQRRSRSLQK